MLGIDEFEVSVEGSGPLMLKFLTPLPGTTPPPFTNAFSLSVASGSSQYVDVGTISPERTDPWSMGGWFYPITTSGALMGNRDGSGIGIDLQTASLGIQVQVIHDSSSNLITVFTGTGSGQKVTQNAWNHVVATYDGSSTAAGVIIYINGSAIGATVLSDTLSATVVSSGHFQIGGESTLPYFSTGYSNNCFYKAGVLSASDITAIYNGGTPQSLAPYSPTNWWQFQNNFLDTNGLNNGSGVNSPTFVSVFPP